MSAGTLQEQVNDLVDIGFEAPQLALSQLSALDARHGDVPTLHRIIEVGIGLVAADNNLGDQAHVAIAELERLVPGVGPLAHADALLVRSDLDFLSGETGKGIVDAKLDVAAYAPFCDGAIAADAWTCNAYDWFYANMWAGVLSVAQESFGNASLYLSAAREIARRAHRPDLEARALALMANLAQTEGNQPLSERLLQQAFDRAAQSGKAAVQEFVELFSSLVLQERGDLQGALVPLRRGQEIATRARHQRRLNQIAVNMIELELKLGRDEQALPEIERTLPLVESRDADRINVLATDRVVALFHLKRLDEARRLLPAVLDSLDRTQGLVERSDYLTSIGEAMAAVGAMDDATRLFERERQSIDAGSDKRFERRMLDRQAAQQAQQQLQRANEIRWWSTVGAIALVLLAAVSSLIPWMRSRNRRLARANDALREQSERDPLTALLNRDGLARRLRDRGQSDAFTGTLLLLDIDHFKNINDTLGHAGGDVVLQEVACRLQSCVREGDLVARWGGEELVVAVLSMPFDADALVDRILQSLASAPVTFQQRSIVVSASIGYGSFPLDEPAQALSFDESLAVADAGMYHAKRSGRRAATRILALPRSLLADLGGLPAAVEREALAGSVRLLVRRLSDQAIPAPAPTRAPDATLAA